LLNDLQLLDSADLTQGDSFMKSSIALVAAMLSTAALAQQAPQTAPAAPNSASAQRPATETAPHASQSVDVGAVFDRLNTSHDGKLTRQQAQAHPTVAANFDSVDTNHDGVISREEFLAAFQPPQ
jgi:EF hand